MFFFLYTIMFCFLSVTKKYTNYNHGAIFHTTTSSSETPHTNAGCTIYRLCWYQKILLVAGWLEFVYEKCLCKVFACVCVCVCLCLLLPVSPHSIYNEQQLIIATQSIFESMPQPACVGTNQNFWSKKHVWHTQKNSKKQCQLKIFLFLLLASMEKCA